MTHAELADSDDYLALLRGVCWRPDDDVPRLVLADWLEENGFGDRAEFVRESVAFDAMGFPDGPCVEGCACGGVGARLGRTTAERGDEWAGAAFGPAVISELVWHRGFVSEVTLTQADFLTHAAAIFSRHPVTTVTLTGVAPANVIDTGRGGVRTRYVLSRVDLPPVRPPDRHGYDFSTWAQASMGWVVRGIPRRTRAGEVARRQDFGYPTEAAAMTALSWDCVCQGRELAGLPPLSPAPARPS